MQWPHFVDAPTELEMTLNKSTIVENSNLFQRQAFVMVYRSYKVGQVSSGTAA